jgi:hypothetical protein
VPKHIRASFKASDFIAADVAGLVVGRWMQIGEYKIPAGLYYGIGFGYSSAQSDADGRLYADFKDSAGAGTSLTGRLRIAAYTPDDMPIAQVGEFPTNKMASSATDMTKQLPFPILGGPLLLGQDYKWLLFFQPDTIGNGTLSRTNTIINMDATKASKAG